ncbi:hypothetical protein V8F33_014242, partial [Rhypophila sp. PSN 637]
SSNKEQWLFDTGSTVHICNNRALFQDYEKLKKPGMVSTGGGPITPQGKGTVEITALVGYEKEAPVYSTMALSNCLYIPTFPLNIVSGHRLYASGGTLIKQKLFSASRKPLALLNFSDNGFFLTVKGVRPPAVGPKGCNHSIQPVTWLCHAARLWHVRLGHIGLELLKRTALVTTGLPNFQKVRPNQLRCTSCDAAKMLRKPSRKPVKDPAHVLDRIEGDIFVIRPTPLNNKPYGLVLVDRKSRFRVLRLLTTKGQAVE